MSPQGSCAVCGRTLLVGERVDSYVSTAGRHEVCELCAGRAAELGWLPSDEDGAEERMRAEAGRRTGFFARFLARPEGTGREEGVAQPADSDAEEVEQLEVEEPAPAFESPAIEDEPPAIQDLDTERYDVEAEWAAENEPAAERPNPLRRLADLFQPTSREIEPDSVSPTPPDPSASDPEPRDERESGDPRRNLQAARERGGLPTPALDQAPSQSLPDPAGRGMRPRRLQPDHSPSTRFDRAISRFNAGEAGRTVAGLTRTLGAPSVSVGDLAGVEEVVRVTVAWELTWYQWGVDLGDELRPVYELDKGFEIDEIDAAARQWNASAHDGRIVMVAPRREAESGRPVPH